MMMMRMPANPAAKFALEKSYLNKLHVWTSFLFDV